MRLSAGWCPAVGGSIAERMGKTTVREPTAPAGGAPPRVWLVLSDKLGDNAQLRVLAEALGWPFETRRVLMKPEYVLGKPRFEVTLDHVDRERSDPLEPPWPDLVLTIGRRCAMVALWIREQAGGRPKIVLVGRPKKGLEAFDLIVAPPQFRMPEAANVVPLSLPLMRADPQKVAAAGARWRDRLAAMARPLTAVLVGGATKPFRFDRGVAADLMAGLETMLARDGGSLYLTTSRRTRPEVVEELRRRTPPGSAFYAWRPEGGENPYFGLLACADRFVVTGDSVSMMVEVARLGRPLAIYDLPLARDPLVRLRYRLGRRLSGRGVAGRLGEGLRRRGVIGISRDLRGFHARLYAEGLAVPFGATFRPPREIREEEVTRIAERVRRLVA